MRHLACTILTLGVCVARNFHFDLLLLFLRGESLLINISISLSFSYHKIETQNLKWNRYSNNNYNIEIISIK